MSTNLKMSCSCLNAVFCSTARKKDWSQQAYYPIVLANSLTTRSNLSISHLKRDDKQHSGQSSFHQKTQVDKYFLLPPNQILCSKSQFHSYQYSKNILGKLCCCTFSLGLGKEGNFICHHILILLFQKIFSVEDREVPGETW